MSARDRTGLLLLHITLAQEFQARVVQELAQSLPPAAIPQAMWAVLPGLPRTPAGKVLRSALPSLLPPAAGASPPTEAQVMAAFVEALGRQTHPVYQQQQQQQLALEPTSHFFEHLGGTSLAAVAAAAQLGIDQRLLYAYPTARSLAAALRDPGTSSAPEPGRPGMQGSATQAVAGTAATAEQGPGSSSVAGAQGEDRAPAQPSLAPTHVVVIPAADSSAQPAPKRSRTDHPGTCAAGAGGYL
jgi:hypothetical protein